MKEQLKNKIEQGYMVILTIYKEVKQIERVSISKNKIEYLDLSYIFSKPQELKKDYNEVLAEVLDGTMYNPKFYKLSGIKEYKFLKKIYINFKII